jgi:hypothetical protein
MIESEIKQPATLIHILKNAPSYLCLVEESLLHTIINEHTLNEDIRHAIIYHLGGENELHLLIDKAIGAHDHSRTVFYLELLKNLTLDQQAILKELKPESKLLRDATSPLVFINTADINDTSIKLLLNQGITHVTLITHNDLLMNETSLSYSLALTSDLIDRLNEKDIMVERVLSIGDYYRYRYTRNQTQEKIPLQDTYKEYERPVELALQVVKRIMSEETFIECCQGYPEIESVNLNEIQEKALVDFMEKKNHYFQNVNKIKEAVKTKEKPEIMEKNASLYLYKAYMREAQKIKPSCYVVFIDNNEKRREVVLKTHKWYFNHQCSLNAMDNNEMPLRPEKLSQSTQGISWATYLGVSSKMKNATVDAPNFSLEPA